MLDCLLNVVFVLARFQSSVTTGDKGLAVDSHDLARDHLAHALKLRVSRCPHHPENFAKTIGGDAALHQRVGENSFELGTLPLSNFRYRALKVCNILDYSVFLKSGDLLPSTLAPCPRE